MLHRALRLLRTYHQMSQIELAKRLGISNSYLSELEKEGPKNPRWNYSGATPIFSRCPFPPSCCSLSS